MQGQYGILLPREIRSKKDIYLADEGNHAIHILLRYTLEGVDDVRKLVGKARVLRHAHNVAVDSRGDLLVSETYAGRIQKFVYKGLDPVAKKDQGVVWPRSTE